MKDTFRLLARLALVASPPLFACCCCGGWGTRAAPTVATTPVAPPTEPKPPPPDTRPAIRVDLPPFDKGVVLSARMTLDGNGRGLVEGRTNLPEGTVLHARLESPGFSAGISSSVAPDGSYRIGPFGPPSGLPRGRYEVAVNSVISELQPDAVRRVIGMDGERLTGPLVSKGTLGPVARTTTSFTVGR